MSIEYPAELMWRRPTITPPQPLNGSMVLAVSVAFGTLHLVPADELRVRPDRYAWWAHVPLPEGAS